MPDYKYILVERNENVGIATLNRPKELNALNFQLVGELASALEDFDRDEAIHCIIITGAGERAFAAGADIKEMADKSPLEMMSGGFEAWQRIRTIKTPLIAAINGYALGGGLELAMHCDIIIATENSAFGQPEIKLGIIPGAGATQRLARTIGKYRTMEMVLTGSTISAHELAAHGLINHVVPAGEHMTTAMKLAQTIAAQAPVATRLAKDAILAAFETSLEEGLRIEQKDFFLLFTTQDMREGMQAFIEKRKATFQGK
ncbi:MAG TPA: enoyl-CoA hydratase-related protein [Dictyobacter sp.]|jgi:enoyl-CoA hydratase|nr:enoyl-CoA hydratase-related protein [Dictyobacter sp.]